MGTMKRDKMINEVTKAAPQEGGPAVHEFS